MKQTKAIIEYGLPGFIKSLLQALDNGWEIDDDNPPAVYGFAYEAHLVSDTPISEEARISRAEILHRARQAKAEKAAAAKQEQ